MGWRYAAVAAVFRQGPAGVELLFIRRSSPENDPWGGQIAFPGGRAEPGDADLEHTAIRETREELSLDLGASESLGPLDEIRAQARRVIEPMAIRPYAFGWTDPTAPDLIPNQEVASAFWTPFDDLRDPERATTYEASRAGEPRTFQAIDIGGDPPLWGLTHRMVQDLLARLPV